MKHQRNLISRVTVPRPSEGVQKRIIKQEIGPRKKLDSDRALWSRPSQNLMTFAEVSVSITADISEKQKFSVMT
jgi:hypothetical protein